jgi:hypothetical protein
MGTKRIIVLLALLTFAVSAYAWENPPPRNNSNPGTVSQGNDQVQPLAQQPPFHPVGPSGQTPVSAPARDANAGTDATGWPVYPYPQYHNPHYGGSSPRDIFSGTVDWLIGFPSTLMDRVSNFLDRKVFPQVPAAQGSRPSAPGQVQALHPVPEKPASLPAAIPYKPGDSKTD